MQGVYKNRGKLKDIILKARNRFGSSMMHISRSKSKFISVYKIVKMTALFFQYKA